MNNNHDLHLLTLSALLHDIGKFVERADMELKSDQMRDDLYNCSHASYTKAFLDQYLPKLNELKISKGESVTEMAAKHHKPNTFMQLIIAEADREASGHERIQSSKNFVKEVGKEKRPLLPVMERISLNLENDGWYEKDCLDSFWPIGTIENQTLEDFLPQKEEKYKPDEMIENYKDHFKSFCVDVEKISYSVTEDNLFCSIITIKNLLFKYLWCLPEDTRNYMLQDTSLYDHSRLTAMLAVCLYEYHTKNEKNKSNPEDFLDKLNYRIRYRTEEKYLLWGGDISGIQKFIYNVDKSGAYRALKGRSFFMQLLPLQICKRILKKLGLPESQIIMATGGYLSLLLPNLEDVKRILIEETEKINLELYKEFSGDIFVRSGFKTFKPHVLYNHYDDKKKHGYFSEIWYDLFQEIKKQDYTKYKNITSKGDYETIFYPSAAIMQDEFEKIGNKLKDGNNCVLFKAEEGFLKFELLKRKDFEKHSDFEKVNSLLVLDTNLLGEPGCRLPLHSSIELFPAGGLHKFSADFNEVADAAEGISMLGALRMDIDDLGKIIRNGLKDYREKKNYLRKDLSTEPNEKQKTLFNCYSIGRLSTLSTQITIFVSFIVNKIIDKYQDENKKNRAIMVYGGGDDIFIIGQWHIIPELAIDIKDYFTKFCCNNPAFSLSGGIYLMSGKYPVYRAAEAAGEAENQAKEYFRKVQTNSKNKKNAISFIGQTFDWFELVDIKKLVEEIKRLNNNKPLISRIIKIGDTYRDECILKDQLRKGIDPATIQKVIEAGKWQWRMAYHFHRLSEKNSELKEIIKELENYFSKSDSSPKGRGICNAQVMGRWAELLCRQKNMKINNNSEKE